MTGPPCIARNDNARRTWCDSDTKTVDHLLSDTDALRDPFLCRVCPNCSYALASRLAILDPTRPRFVAYGGRRFSDDKAVHKALDKVFRKYPRMVLVNGKCPLGGADRHAETWARARGVPLHAYPPDFERAIAEGRARNNAFLHRNAAMAKSGLQAAIEFPGGNGTTHMHRCLLGEGLTPENRRLWQPMQDNARTNPVPEPPPQDPTPEPPTQAPDPTPPGAVRLDECLLPITEDSP